MSEVSTWNAIDASNNATPPDGFPEGMQPSAVNDAARMMMGALRREHDLVTAKIGSTPGAISTTTINATTVTASGAVTGSTLTSTGNASVAGNFSAGNTTVAALTMSQGHVNGLFGVDGLTTLTSVNITGNSHINGACQVDHGVQYPYILTHGATNIGFAYSYDTPTILWMYANDAFVGTIGVTLSDERLKRDIRPITVDPLAALQRVNLRAFNQLSTRLDPADGVQHRDVGFIAQQLREAVPDAVIEPPVSDAFLSVDLMPLVAYCVGAIQQLAERVAWLEKEKSHV